MQIGAALSKYWWFLTVFGIAAILIWGLLSVLRNSDELQGKPTYSYLQGIEFTRRSSKLTGPIVISADSGMGPVIGVPTDSARFPNAWIYASKTAKDGTPYIVKEREAHLIVTCQQVETVLSESALKSVSPIVSNLLRKQCSWWRHEG